MAMRLAVISEINILAVDVFIVRNRTSAFSGRRTMCDVRSNALFDYNASSDIAASSRSTASSFINEYSIAK